jgi:hypothetical protein
VRSRLLSLAGLVLSVTEIGRTDPIHLATLVSRRLPPRIRRKSTAVLAAATPAGSIRGLIFLIGDQQAPSESQHGRARPGWLRDTLALHLGLEVPESAAPTVRARRAWELGDMACALATVGKRTRWAKRWNSVALTLDPEFDPLTPSDFKSQLPAQITTALRGECAGTSDLRVLHLLTNSVPHTQSGYTLRSHSVLRALTAEGIHAVATTRVGYPQSVGVFDSRFAEVMDDICYLRLPTSVGMSLPSPSSAAPLHSSSPSSTPTDPT